MRMQPSPTSLNLILPPISPKRSAQQVSQNFLRDQNPECFPIKIYLSVMTPFDSVDEVVGLFLFQMMMKATALKGCSQLNELLLDIYGTYTQKKKENNSHGVLPRVGIFLLCQVVVARMMAWNRSHPSRTKGTFCQELKVYS